VKCENTRKTEMFVELSEIHCDVSLDEVRKKSSRPFFRLQPLELKLNLRVSGWTQDEIRDVTHNLFKVVSRRAF
jgi:hypothetical protein